MLELFSLFHVCVCFLKKMAPSSLINKESITRIKELNQSVLYFGFNIGKVFFHWEYVPVWFDLKGPKSAFSSPKLKMSVW